MSGRTNPEHPKTRTSVVVVGLAAVVLLILGVAALTGGGSPPSDQSAPNITLSYFDGTTGDLADLAGQPVVLNFWASWCPACIGEMPDFAEAHRLLGDRVSFVGVNMQEVSIDDAVDLAALTGVEYPLAHDPDGAIFRAFGGLAMPTTVFIDSSGAVARVHAGTIFFDELTAIIEAEL